MRKWLYVVLCLSLLFSVATACSDDEDKLTNKWQLRRYEFPDGTTQTVDSVFYNFQKGSFSAICLLKNGSYQTFFGNYSLKGDKISIILLPQSMEDENYSFYMGWENGERTFTMEELTSSSLHLEYEGVRYIFRRY